MIGEALKGSFIWPTLEAATSCAVLAAISWEEAMSSSYWPFSLTTRSAESLTAEATGRSLASSWKGGQDKQLCALTLTAAAWRPSPQL